VPDVQPTIARASASKIENVYFMSDLSFDPSVFWTS
jgi:hypothetical protein